MLSWIRSLAAVAGVSLLAACGGGNDVADAGEALATDRRFTVLNEAVAAAGLGAALSGPGPVTVFAPTDEAFAALLSELGVTKAQLLADRALLTQVLGYHVLGTRVAAAEVPLGRAVATAQGGVFKVERGAAGALTVTDGRNRAATVVQTDLAVANGVVHVVDRVLLPADRNLVQTALALPQFSILVEAVQAAGLADALAQPGPLTVFAPTDAAFAALLAELGISKEALLADRALLTQVLTYHVVPGRVLRAEVPLGAPVTTLQGGSFTVDATLSITDAQGRRAGIAATDVFASNGVVHVLDRVILP